MKGNPILRLCLVLLLLAAVLIPVCRLTLNFGRPSETPVSADPEQSGTPATLRGRLLLHAAPPPLCCAVSLRGKTLLTDKNLLSPGEYAADAEVSPGDDLLVTAEWDDGNPHAILVEFLPQGTSAPVSRSYWAKRSLEDVLTIAISPDR